MRMRPTGSAAVVFAAVTLAVTATSPRPAEAFFFLPMFQNQPVTDSRQGRPPSDNRWREETAKPVKPSTSTRSKEEDGKSSSSSAGKGAKSTTKSEAKSNSGQGAGTSRSRSTKQEPAASKSNSRASTAAQRPSPSSSSASTSAPEATPAGAGSHVGDILDEKLGEVFKARIDELLKQSPK